MPIAKINPIVCVGVPTWGRVTVTWARAYRHLGGPLGATMAELYVEGKPIAEARNTLMRDAIATKADFLFMLGDDVLPQGDTITRLLHRAWAHPEIDLFTGVYWTKSWPTSPYLWRGMQRGPYWDWKFGEFFQVDQAGCDCLLIRLSDRVKALGPDWFSTRWLWTEEQDAPDALATEDFYFYTLCRKAGIELWCDTNVQCLHEDRTSGMMFGLTAEMPQVTDRVETLPDPAVSSSPNVVQIADIGCGNDTPWFGPPEKVKVVRFDGDENALPDFRCDLRALPVPDQSFDLVHSRHVLEHFTREEAPTALAEWVRLLRVGGELRLSVPNLITALKRVLAIEEQEVAPEAYPWWQLYGEQRDERDVHKNGFTPRRLRKLLELHPDLADVVVTADGPDDINLSATARKAQHTALVALAPIWARLAAEGRAEMPGLSVETEPPAEAPGTGAAPYVAADVIAQTTWMLPSPRTNGVAPNDSPDGTVTDYPGRRYIKTDGKWDWVPARLSYEPDPNRTTLAVPGPADDPPSRSGPGTMTTSDTAAALDNLSRMSQKLGLYESTRDFPPKPEPVEGAPV